MVRYFNGKKTIRHLEAKAGSVFQKRMWFFRDPLWLKKVVPQESHFELVIEKKHGKGIVRVGGGKVKMLFSSKRSEGNKMSYL